MAEVSVQSIEWLGDIADDIERYLNRGELPYHDIPPVAWRCMALCLRQIPIDPDMFDFSKECTIPQSSSGT